MNTLGQAVHHDPRVEDLELVLRRTLADLARAKSNGFRCRKWWKPWHRPRLTEIPGSFVCDRLEHSSFDGGIRFRAQLRLICKCGHVQKFAIVVDT